MFATGSQIGVETRLADFCLLCTLLEPSETSKLWHPTRGRKLLHGPHIVRMGIAE